VLEFITAPTARPIPHLFIFTIHFFTTAATETLEKLLSGLSLTEEVSLRLLSLPFGWSCHCCLAQNLGVCTV